MEHILYNNDRPVARFLYEKGIIDGFCSLVPALLPMQLCRASAEGFALWVRERAIDLNVLLHRRLAAELLGSRDKTAIAVATHMYSVSDTFTCFPKGEFTPRDDLCRVSEQNGVCDFILISSDTSLRLTGGVTPNFSTDGSFPKTWRYENGVWWLYKLQSTEASRSEYAIGKALRQAGWDAAEYAFDGRYRKRIKSRNFVGKDEFFEPYDSFRFFFEDRSDSEKAIRQNINSLGDGFAKAFRHILLADALFMNTDRHMRNFGVIRSAVTGELLRMAPNYDNNQAYRGNPGMAYGDSMLRDFHDACGWTAWDAEQLEELLNACAAQKYLAPCLAVGSGFLSGRKAD